MLQSDELPTSSSSESKSEYIEIPLPIIPERIEYIDYPLPISITLPDYTNPSTNGFSYSTMNSNLSVPNGMMVFPTTSYPTYNNAYPNNYLQPNYVNYQSNYTQPINMNQFYPYNQNYSYNGYVGADHQGNLIHPMIPQADHGMLQYSTDAIASVASTTIGADGSQNFIDSNQHITNLLDSISAVDSSQYDPVLVNIQPNFELIPDELNATVTEYNVAESFEERKRRMARERQRKYRAKQSEEDKLIKREKDRNRHVSKRTSLTSNVSSTAASASEFSTPESSPNQSPAPALLSKTNQSEDIVSDGNKKVDVESLVAKLFDTNSRSHSPASNFPSTATSAPAINPTLDSQISPPKNKPPPTYISSTKKSISSKNTQINNALINSILRNDFIPTHIAPMPEGLSNQYDPASSMPLPFPYSIFQASNGQNGLLKIVDMPPILNNETSSFTSPTKLSLKESLKDSKENIAVGADSK